MNVNTVIFAGRLTRDPAMKYLPNQMAVVDFGLVSNRQKVNKQTGEKTEVPTFVDCTAFSKTAEVINEHFKKGKEIYIEGNLRYETWDDKNGGGKRSKLSVVVNNFQFVGGRDGGGDGGQSVDRSSNQDRPSGRPAPSQRPAVSDEQQFDEKDIPFAWEGRRQQGA